MRITFCLLSAVAILPVTTPAVVFTILGATLKGVDAQPMPQGGLLILAASTTDAVFTPPTPTDFFPGADDIVVGAWSIDNNVGEVNVQASQSLTGTWSAGDPVMLYWFPTLSFSPAQLASIDSQQPGGSTPYGTYRDPSSTPEIGDAWVTPSEGIGSPPQGLRFETTDQNPLSTFTGLPTNITPVPEPASFASVLAAGCLIWAVAARRTRRIR